MVITPIEMYREMQATHQAVRDVAGKLDGVLESHGRRLDEHDKDLGDHEGRIRHGEQAFATKEDLEVVIVQVQDLQHGRWKTAGAAAAGSLVASSGVLALIATKVFGH